MKKAIVLHPFLLAVFPIIFLYDHNLAEVPRDQVTLPLVLAGAVALAIFGISWLVIRNTIKAGLIVSLVLTLFFSYGHAVKALEKLPIDGQALTGALPWLWVFFLATGVLLIVRTHRSLRDLTNFLNAAAVSMIAISILSIVTTTISTNNILKELGLSAEIGRATPAQPPAKSGLPDIYYIILDSYPSRATLKEVYAFDNSEWLDYLKSRGFYVAEESRSNYAMTYLSLASSLNMEHIDYLTDKVGPKTQSTAVPAQMIKNSKAAGFLRARGYRTVHFRSGWSGTDRNDFADVQIEYGTGDEFAMMLIETTALRSFEPELGLVKTRARQRILSIFRNLKEIPKRREPTFTFAHLVPPHPPYFFGAKGEEVKRPKLKMAGLVWTQKQKYLDQIVFVNNRMKAVIDRILAESKVPPIIVIQADHGSASTFYTEKRGGWRRPTDRQLKERMRILNAFYLPGGDYRGLRRDITPVNTFRLIFNRFLGGRFKPVKDISYYSDYRIPYVFTDVTDVVSD